MILVIDNYDSFTYNLVQYLGELGYTVEVRRNDAATLDEIAEMAPDQIVISPGPGTPDDAGISVDLIKRFHKEIFRSWAFAWDIRPSGKPLAAK